MNTTESNSSSKHIRIGIGGWTFEPWRDNFYPSGLAHSKELHQASHRLNAIEVNGTHYSTFKPPTFSKWHSETPDGFMFSLKANRFAANRPVLADAGDSITRFVESGISELKDKLGPIVWQFMPTKPFEPGDFEAFLALLPNAVDGRKLRHALDVRHESFATPAFLALARRYGGVPVHTDSPKFPAIADAQADFAYLRLMRSQSDVPTGYTPEAIAQWARACATGPAASDHATCLCTSSTEPKSGRLLARWPCWRSWACRFSRAGLAHQKLRSGSPAGLHRVFTSSTAIEISPRLMLIRTAKKPEPATVRAFVGKR